MSMAVAEHVGTMTGPTLNRPSSPQLPRGARMEYVEQSNGRVHPLAILSFRDARHLDFLVDQTMNDELVTFQGWGVVGGGHRSDRKSHYWALHDELKPGRSKEAKVPIAEPPEYAVKHIDWNAVHPDMQYLKDPKEFAKLWKARRPFHLIAPVLENGELTEAVVTPAYDAKVAANVPYQTACFFWENDPAFVEFLKRLKRFDKKAIFGLTSGNESGKQPDFLTSDFIGNLRERNQIPFHVVVEDPLVDGMVEDGLELASSHSQFVIPLKERKNPVSGKLEPVEKAYFQQIRKGSLSAEEFTRLTGFDVAENPNVNIASRMRSDVDLDQRLAIMADRLEDWHRGRYVRALKQFIGLG